MIVRAVLVLVLAGCSARRVESAENYLSKKLSKPEKVKVVCGETDDDTEICVTDQGEAYYCLVDIVSGGPDTVVCNPWAWDHP